MEPKHVRSQLAKIIGDQRGLLSRSFLRGMASAIRTCFANEEPACPYGDATDQMNAFWAGHLEGLEVVRKLTVYRNSSDTGGRAILPHQEPDRTPVPLVAAHRAATPWEPEEIQDLIELYDSGTLITDLAKTFSRTDNAIVWQLWSEAANSLQLLKRMRENGHTRPLRRADLRNQKDASDWVSAFLRGATKLMLRTHQEVTLDALLRHANGTLATWPPHGHEEDACQIEFAAAAWMFNHPERWAGHEHW